MGKQPTELRYAVRFRVIAKYFGQLCLVLAALTLVPLVVSVIFGEYQFTIRHAIVVGVLGGLGVGTARLRTPGNMQTNEGIVLVTLIFSLTPLAMTYPMMSAGLGFMDALFEAISGVTTTGLSVKATLVDAPATFLFTRAWMQWYGGLGIVVLSVALIMQPGLVAKSLAGSETEIDNVIGGTRAHARHILQIYAVLTSLGVMGAVLTGVRFFDALLYTFAAVSTGGFAPYDSSLAPMNWPAQVWITLLCLAGAIPLVFYSRLVFKTQKSAMALLQLKAILILAMVGSLAISAFLWLGTDMQWPEILHHAPLLAFSAQTTAGFSSMPCAQLGAGPKLILICSMLVGGGVGSTAGGFKLLRLLIAVNAFRIILLRTCLPNHAIIETRLASRRLLDEEIKTAILLILLFIAVVALSCFPFVVMGYEPLDALFEVVSATGTVGLSVGLTSADLPALLKGVLCVDMLMGRLEIIAWLVLLYPWTWFGRRMEGA
ncbi:MAG: TrkH family potassium uptake protein [Desulfobulbus sp.]